MVHIHNGILLSHKKNKTMPFSATWMELQTLILSEVSQKDKYHMIAHLYNLTSGTNEPIYRKEINSGNWRTGYGLPKGRWGGMDWEFEVSRC